GSLSFRLLSRSGDWPGGGGVSRVRLTPLRCRASQSALETVVNRVLSWPPRAATTPTITAAISPTIRPYSTAVAPRSSWRSGQGRNLRPQTNSSSIGFSLLVAVAFLWREAGTLAGASRDPVEASRPRRRQRQSALETVVNRVLSLPPRV